MILVKALKTYRRTDIWDAKTQSFGVRVAASKRMVRSAISTRTMAFKARDEFVVLLLAFAT